MTAHQPAIDRMHALLAAWEEASDRRAVFLSCYTQMTENMLAAAQAGQFSDNTWVTGLLEHFAGYYFDALQAYEQQPGSTPAVWQVPFETARDPQAHVLQHLMLGINAHINYDLVFALEDVLRPDWKGLSQQQRTARYEDHCQVNSVIAQTVDAVQDSVVERYAPKLDILDDALGRLDELLVSTIISVFRDRVWELAVEMLESPDIAEQNIIRLKIERSTMELAESVRNWSLGKGLRHFFDEYLEEQ